MLKKIPIMLVVVACAMLAADSKVHAYGAAHVGYTHVGPNGVYHTGETVARGPGGTYAGGRTTAAGYGGAAYHSGAAYHTDYGAAAGGYHYAPTYAAGAHYAYVR